MKNGYLCGKNLEEIDEIDSDGEVTTLSFSTTKDRDEAARAFSLGIEQQDDEHSKASTAKFLIGEELLTSWMEDPPHECFHNVEE